MNSTELRNAVGEVAERAKHERGIPSRADVKKFRVLFTCRKDFLTQTLGSSLRLMWTEEPDWNSWESIAAFFDKYHDALVEIDNKSARPMAGVRLSGI